MSKVKVPPKVLEGLEAFRASGQTNMLDRPVVARLALEKGYIEAAEWVQEHRKEYAQGIFRGFEADEEAS